VDRLDPLSRKCGLLINVDKTKIMASDDIACRTLIQNEQLDQVDTFPYHTIPTLTLTLTLTLYYFLFFC